ncbi:MAG: serine acetyltransferase [Methylophaga sp.]|nr:serine acetyltransferase [Methylophaga sp.]
MVSSVTPDWSREEKSFFSWSPSRSLLASIRSYQAYNDRGGIWLVLRQLTVLRHRFWSIVTGADIPLNCQLGGGLLIPHPNGIVIHPDVKVGCNCLIFQQVTLGATKSGVPHIGGHVDIGAGAKVLGSILIGDDVLIGANSVVLKNVPNGKTVVGIPAEIK